MLKAILKKSLLISFSLLVLSACDQEEGNKGLLSLLSKEDKVGHAKLINDALEGKDEEACKTICATKHEATGKNILHFIVEAGDFSVDTLKRVFAHVPIVPDDFVIQKDQAGKTPFELLVESKNLSVESSEVFAEKIPAEAMMTAIAARPKSEATTAVMINLVTKEPDVLKPVFETLTAEDFKNFNKEFYVKLSDPNAQATVKKAFPAFHTHVVAKIKELKPVKDYLERDDVIKLNGNISGKVRAPGKNAKAEDVETAPYLPIKSDADEKVKTAFALMSAIAANKPDTKAVGLFLDEINDNFAGLKSLSTHLNFTRHEARALTEGVVLGGDEKTDDIKKEADEALAAATEVARIKEEERIADEKKIAEELEAKRIADEKKAADEKKIAEELEVEAKRIADEKKAADEKKIAEELEAKRIADEKKAADAKKGADELN